MSLVPSGSTKRSRVRPLNQDEYTNAAERLIERDFFPDLYQSRPDTNVVDLTAVEQEPASEPVVLIDSETLDSFNDKFVSTDTVKLQKSIAIDQSRRDDHFLRSYGAEGLNVLMFNHPGLPSRPSRRSKIDFANTRFPSHVHAALRTKKRPSANHISESVSVSVSHSTRPNSLPTDDILSRTLRRSKPPSNT